MAADLGSEAAASRSAMAKAMGYLARREYAQAELIRKLTGKGISATLAEEVVARLTDQDYQSDERFAEIYVRSKIGRGYGRLVIAYELRQRGIEGELIETCLDQPEEFWHDLATDIVARKFRNASPKDQPRMARFLARRGFASDVIYRVVG